jgi:hypothetical protein
MFLLFHNKMAMDQSMLESIASRALNCNALGGKVRCDALFKATDCNIAS